MRALDLKLAAGVTLPGEGPLQIGASVFVPERPQPLALVCLAGGNMNRRYWHLQSGGDDSFSFAAALTAQGYVVVTLDYLGLGESSKPADGHALTPEILTRANVSATADVLARLREGRLAPDLPALPALRSVGVGHSMGGMMTVLLQHAARPHAALALLGFTTRGLPQYLPPAVRDLPRDAQRAQLVEFARRMFPQPYPIIKSSGNGAEVYGSRHAEPAGIAALKSATDCLLPVPAFMSMLPGNVAPEAAAIDVPVYLGVGEHDMTGPPQEIPAAFPASPAVTLEIYPGTGHSHFLFPARRQLFEQLGRWCAALP
jgi:pimeloyl-ACP methyl ester carboxylesterase